MQKGTNAYYVDDDAVGGIYVPSKKFSLFPWKYFQMETDTLCAIRSTEVVVNSR